MILNGEAITILFGNELQPQQNTSSKRVEQFKFALFLTVTVNNLHLGKLRLGLGTLHRQLSDMSR